MPLCGCAGNRCRCALEMRGSRARRSGPRAAEPLQGPQDLLAKGVKVAETLGCGAKDDLVVDAAVLVNEDIAEAFDALQSFRPRLGDDPGACELLEQVILLGWETEPQAGHKKAAEVDHGLDRDLQQSLARALGFDLQVVLEATRRDAAKLHQVSLEVGELREYSLTIEHARRSSSNPRTGAGNPRTPGRCGTRARRAPLRREPKAPCLPSAPAGARRAGAAGRSGCRAGASPGSRASFRRAATGGDLGHHSALGRHLRRKPRELPGARCCRRA